MEINKKYGLFGDYIDTIVLKIGDKSVRFPKELREVLDILCKANKETSVSLLKEQTYKLAERIHSIPDKVLSSSFKLKLIETINSSNPKFVAVAPAQFAPDPFLLADLIPSQEESLLQTKIR